MKDGLVAALAIAGKDLRTELRTKESLTASLSFSLVILVLFSFAFDLGHSYTVPILASAGANIIAAIIIASTSRMSAPT